jgi:glutamyl-tRNA synthetase
LLLRVLAEHNMKIGMVMQALRLALTGVDGGPDLMDIIEIIGKEETIQRIETALERLEEYI